MFDMAIDNMFCSSKTYSSIIVYQKTRLENVTFSIYFIRFPEKQHKIRMYMSH